MQRTVVIHVGPVRGGMDGSLFWDRILEFIHSSVNSLRVISQLYFNLSMIMITLCIDRAELPEIIHHWCNCSVQNSVCFLTFENANLKSTTLIC